MHLMNTLLTQKLHLHMKGMGVAGERSLGMLQRQDLAAAPPVKQVLEAPELFELMETLLQVSQSHAGAGVMHSVVRHSVVMHSAPPQLSAAPAKYSITTSTVMP